MEAGSSHLFLKAFILGSQMFTSTPGLRITLLPSDTPAEQGVQILRSDHGGRDPQMVTQQRLAEPTRDTSLICSETWGQVHKEARGSLCSVLQPQQGTRKALLTGAFLSQS